MELNAFCEEFGTDADRARAVLAERAGERDLAVEAMLGLGAWLTAIAAVVLVGVILIGVIDIDMDALGPVMAAIGLGGFAAGLRLRGVSGPSPFRRQLATATALAGGALVAAGAVGVTHELGAAALAAAILAAVAAARGRDPVLQFLLGTLAVALGIVALSDARLPYRWEAGALFTALGVALQLRPPPLDLRPIAAVALLTVPALSFWPDWPPLGQGWGARAMHAALILWICFELWAAMGRPRAYLAPVAALALGGVLLAVALPPAASAALIILLVAVAIGSWRWAAGGALLEAIFLFRFYYDLELTLLAKSGLLVAVGAALLGAHAVLAHRPGRRAG